MSHFQNFRENHLFAFLHAFDREERPLDWALQNYFRKHKSIGSHDRRFIGDTIYELMRWKGRGSTWEERYALRCTPSSSIHLSISEWGFKELCADYGEPQAIALCHQLNEPAPLTIRVNFLKTTREELVSLLQRIVPLECCTKSAAGIRILKRVNLTSLPEFKQGLFEIQDEGSQLVSELIQCRPGDQILDYCSGSGGKSLAIAHRLAGQGRIYLHDVRPRILEQAKLRLSRAGVKNGHIGLPSKIGSMDWVLVDVPCSGSGTYRRNPDAKWKMDEATIQERLSQQRALFAEALRYVRPGGRILYSTCSLFRRENEEQMNYFLNRYPLELAGPPLSLLPESKGPDGFFAVLLHMKAHFCYPG